VEQPGIDQPANQPARSAPRALPLSALPSPPGHPVLGHLRAFRREPLGFLERTARDNGDMATLRLGPGRVLFVAHPDLARELLVTRQRDFHKGRGLERARVLLGNGLLTSEGEQHRRQRRLVQPAFHHRRIAAYAEVMRDHATRTAAGWADGQAVDLHREMMRLTLAVVARTLFGVSVGADAAATIGGAMDVLLAGANRSMSPWAELLDRLPLPSVRRINTAMADLDGAVNRIIAERRDAGIDTGDLLSMLLLAQDGGDGQPAGGLTDRQVRDEALTLMLAGHETTANALTWAFWLLSRDRAVEARLHAELDGALGGRAPGAGDLGVLPYTRQVLAEAIRLYPPAWILGRRAVRDTVIGGHEIRAGTIVIASQWVLHRDPRFQPDPERFDPDRWLPERAAQLPRYAYFPFGGGARQCIGESFAWTEGTILLATLASRWRARPVPGHEPVPRPAVTLRPLGGLPVTLHRRA
jgi:cytochrome P450